MAGRRAPGSRSSACGTRACKRTSTAPFAADWRRSTTMRTFEPSRLDSLTREQRSALRHVVAIALVVGLALPSVALAYPGEQLLNFASTYIIAPLGLIALVV